jgi:hypothetical protein
MDTDTVPRLLPAETVARMIGVTGRWLRSECESGRIPHLRDGRRIIVDRQTVERLLIERANSMPVEAAR